MPAVEVTIDGDVVPIIESSLHIESIIGQTVDTCDFEIYDPDRTITVPTMRDVVITRTDTGDRIFGGMTVWVVGRPHGFTRYWDVSCQDYTVLLDRTLCIQNYEAEFIYPGNSLGILASSVSSTGTTITLSADAIETLSVGRWLYVDNEWMRIESVSSQQSVVVERGSRTTIAVSHASGVDVHLNLMGDRAIIAAAFERDVLGAFGSDASSEIEARNNVTQGLNSLSNLQYKYNSLREVVTQLAQYVGYDYYVDYNRSLHYYYREDNDAAYSLTDGTPSNTALNYRGATWKRDGTRVSNTFALFGDRLYSDPETKLISANGTQTEFSLTSETIGFNYPLLPEPGRGRDSIRVEINAGTTKTLTNAIHNGGNGENFLSVSGASFILDNVRIGDVVLNTTDGSWGEITARTATSLTATLSGGTDNHWDNGDVASVPNWTDQSVDHNEARGLEEGDVFHATVGRVLQFRNAPPSGTYAIRIRYTYNFVGGHVDSNQPSIDMYGRVFARRVVVSDVNSAQGLVQKMAHLQEQYSSALEVVSCRITDDMFPSEQDFADAAGRAMPNATDISNSRRRIQAGEWVRFTNNILGVVDKDLLVHRMSTRILGEELMEYELEIRDWEVDI